MNQRPDLTYREEFTRALLDRSPDAHPSALQDVAARRFRVYRNNVHSSLIDALADAYPVVQQLVGGEFFSAMAREFLLQETNRDQSLALYGNGFAEFIEQFAPADALPYLSDIARLERARLEALHATDAKVVTLSDLPADGEQLLHVCFQSHPALHLIGSSHPVYSIWQANHTHQERSSISAADEYVLVTRPVYEVQTIAVDQASARFAHELMQGSTLQQAHTEASKISENFDTGTAFALLLDYGAFSQFKINLENPQ